LRGSIVFALAMLPVAPWASRSLDAQQTDQAKAAAIQERLKRVGADVMSRPDRANDAIRELKAILAEDPRSAEAHMYLGIAYRVLGSPEMIGEAVAELRQALELEPRHVPARFYLAHLYLNLGRATRAREELEAALAQAPGQPQFLALLGETERQVGNPRRSVDLNRQALQANDSLAEARYYLALALLDLKQTDEGIRELERVVQSGPAVVDAYVSLGTAYIEAGRFDAALETLARGTQIDAARPELRILMARAYRSKGLLDQAQAQLKLASSKRGASLASPFQQDQQVEFDLRLEQARLAAKQGRLDAAAESFQRVLDMDPEYAPAKRELAEVRKQMQERVQKKKPGGQR